MQINKLATYVAIYVHISIGIRSSWLGADSYLERWRLDHAALGSVGAALISDIYDGGDSTSRIRVGVSTAGILSMLEIAS